MSRKASAYNSHFVRTCYRPLLLFNQFGDLERAMLWENLVKIGAKVTRYSKYITFQLAEVAVTQTLFATILDRIARLAISPPVVQGIPCRRSRRSKMWFEDWIMVFPHAASQFQAQSKWEIST